MTVITNVKDGVNNSLLASNPIKKPNFKNYLNNYVKFTFGDWTDDFAKMLAGKNVNIDLPNGHQLDLFEKTQIPETGLLRQKNGQGLWKNIKQAYDTAQDVSLQRTGLDAQKFSIPKYVKSMMSGWGKEITESASKSTSFFGKLFGGSKGALKGAVKRMPLVGTALCLLFEVPNIIRSFTSKDGGLVTGTVETAKTGIKLAAATGGMAAGAALGTLLFPGVGTGVGAVIGFIGGALGCFAATTVADKVVGKSFTEIAEEKEAKEKEVKENQTMVANANMQGLPIAPGMNFQGYNPMLPMTPGMNFQGNNPMLPMQMNNFSNNPFKQVDWRERDIFAPPPA